MKNKLKAILWLHTLRLFRYKWTFLNEALGVFLWIMIYIIGTSLFLPNKEEKILINLFWMITAWEYIRVSVRVIGNWINFFLSIGLIEEHIMRNISPFVVLEGRVITSTAVIAVTVFLVGIFIKIVYNVNVLSINNPYILIFGLITLMIQSIYYGKILSLLSLSTSISQTFWNYLNFSSLALFVIPPEKLIFPLNIIISIAPFTSSVYILKNGINGIYTHDLFTLAATFSLINCILMKTLETYLSSKVLKKVLKNGYKGIGYM